MISTSFQRNQFTWLAYFILAYFAYLQLSVGPLVNFLRVELNLTYTEGGYHGSAYALGMVLAGIIGGTVARRWGRTLSFWGGGAGMAFGALMIVLGQHLLVTVAGAFVMGLIGSLLLSTLNAALSDQHGVHRAVALTEANISASVSSTLAPLMVGGLAGIGLGWRVALLLGILTWVVSFVLFRGIPIPAAHNDEQQVASTPSKRMPMAFWRFWVVVMMGGGLEAGLGFWGAAFLNKSVGLPLELSSGLVSVMFAAMVIGRIVGSRLTRTISTNRLLVGTMLIVAVGFPLFWLATLPILNIIGLFVVGLGIANVFPLALSAATSAVPYQADTAAAYVSLAAGLSILTVPQVLGFIADQAGIHAAFGLLGVIVAVGLIVVIANAQGTKAKA